ncbi:hypothetical protein V8C40DRAFT_96931 [Trichoderma camerunense]
MPILGTKTQPYPHWWLVLLLTSPSCSHPPPLGCSTTMTPYSAALSLVPHVLPLSGPFCCFPHADRTSTLHVAVPVLPSVVGSIDRAGRGTPLSTARDGFPVAVAGAASAASYFVSPDEIHPKAEKARTCTSSCPDYRQIQSPSRVLDLICHGVGW